MSVKVKIWKTGRASRSGPTEDYECWANFRKSLDPTEWPNNVLQKNYNAFLVTNVTEVDDYIPYILFRTKKDAMLFLLRFS